MAHDFKRFPELTNQQMQLYYFESPHRQIVDDFRAKVVKVTDGDTIRVRCDFRDFDFPIRFLNVAAPELDERGGLQSRNWLASKIEGEIVDIIMHPTNRVEKWGRLLGEVVHQGISMSEEIIRAGFAISWEEAQMNTTPNFEKEMENTWL